MNHKKTFSYIQINTTFCLIHKNHLVRSKQVMIGQIKGKVLNYVYKKITPRWPKLVSKVHYLLKKNLLSWTGLDRSSRLHALCSLSALLCMNPPICSVSLCHARAYRQKSRSLSRAKSSHLSKLQQDSIDAFFWQEDQKIWCVLLFFHSFFDVSDFFYSQQFHFLFFSLPQSTAHRRLFFDFHFVTPNHCVRMIKLQGTHWILYKSFSPHFGHACSWLVRFMDKYWPHDTLYRALVSVSFTRH